MRWRRPAKGRHSHRGRKYSGRGHRCVVWSWALFCSNRDALKTAVVWRLSGRCGLVVRLFPAEMARCTIVNAADPESNLTLSGLLNRISQGDQNLVKEINIQVQLNQSLPRSSKRD